jgi:hypothetical protein
MAQFAQPAWASMARRLSARVRGFVGAT